MAESVPRMLKKAIRATLSLFCFLGASDASAETVSIPYKGLTLTGELALSEGSELKNGVILMTHGTLGHGKMETLTGLQTVFAERGWNSLSITLSLGQDRREGFYPCRTRHTHLHTDALDEIGAWVDWLRSKGASNVVLFGHSRGGNQTAWFAAERPDSMVSHVVLLAPMTWSQGKAIKDYADRYEKLLDRVIDKAQKAITEGRGGQTIEYVSLLHCPCTDATPETFLSYHRPDPRFHTPNLLPQINVPTLVVAGSADKVVAGLSEAVAPMAKKSKSLSFTLIQDADHFFRDLYAEDIADAMETLFSN